MITEITLKLLSKPKYKQSAMGVFPSIQSAMNAVYKTMASGITPVAMEFLDNLSIRAVEEKFHKGLPIQAGAILITEVDGNLPEEIDFQMKMVQVILSKQITNKKQQIFGLQGKMLAQVLQFMVAKNSMKILLSLAQNFQNYLKESKKSPKNIAL